MAKMFSENAQAALSLLQEGANVDMTAKDIAEAAGIPSTSINGILNGLQRKGFLFREEAEVDGTKVKFIRLTDEGKAADPLADKADK